MPISLAQLRSEVLEHLGVEATDLDSDGGSTNLDRLIDRAFWALCDEVDFKVKDGVDTFQTVDGTRSYDLSSEITDFESVNLVSITDDNDQHFRLEPKPWHWYENEYNEGTDREDFPQYYLRHDKLLYLYPTPDDVYTVTLRHQKSLGSFSDSSIIPETWHEIIMYGATYRGFLRQHDISSSNTFKRLYEMEVAKLKRSKSVAAAEDSQMKYLGVQVLGREY